MTFIVTTVVVFVGKKWTFTEQYYEHVDSVEFSDALKDIAVSHAAKNFCLLDISILYMIL